MELVYRPVVVAALAVMKAMKWRVRATGCEHVPRTGPAVIATNHVGYLDFVFVGAGVRPRGRLVRFLAKTEVFEHPVAGPLMRGMKHIPVDRFGRANAAVEAAVSALERGEVVGMFPESTISRSFVPRDGKSGAARMAMLAGAPLVPGAVWGSQRILTKDRPKNFERDIAITVDFGRSIDYGHDEDPVDVTKRLMSTISELVERAQDSYPQAPRSDDDRWWLPNHLGGTAPTIAQADAMARQDAERRAHERRSKNV
jgi:1-acyl-sn-glycerol-3-phosphate acyltransferase